jgi:hypothetical protein
VGTRPIRWSDEDRGGRPPGVWARWKRDRDRARGYWIPSRRLPW